MVSWDERIKSRKRRAIECKAQLDIGPLFATLIVGPRLCHAFLSYAIPTDWTQSFTLLEVCWESIACCRFPHLSCLFPIRRYIAWFRCHGICILDCIELFLASLLRSVGRHNITASSSPRPFLHLLTLTSFQTSLRFFLSLSFAVVVRRSRNISASPGFWYSSSRPTCSWDWWTESKPINSNYPVVAFSRSGRFFFLLLTSFGTTAERSTSLPPLFCFLWPSDCGCVTGWSFSSGIKVPLKLSPFTKLL